ncbi:MAG: hypothetical protein EXS03_03810 [Phycisphaerales bacterium]|nr:hypothetical protein [Phycisphaerales bacterium]
MSLSNRWTMLATRLGTSSRQLALLMLSGVVAIGIFMGKVAMEPKAAIAAAVPASTVAPASATAIVAAIPSAFVSSTPRWNLAHKPSRSPFAAPPAPKPAAAAAASAVQPAVADAGLVLQATLDGTHAVISGRTMRVGQFWTDPKTNQRFQLIRVGHRSATFACGAHHSDLTMGIDIFETPNE